jgi:Ser/Thr protein kinase RdoA (MazF antagonist)
MTHPYERLTPDLVLAAVDSAGFRTDGRLLALNSYENRVLQLGLEQPVPPFGEFLVAKFYRPERWSDAAIGEEHAFALALAAAEIPVVPPLQDANGETLHHYAGFRFALYRRQGGRWPDLDRPERLAWTGRFLGRIHQLGAARDFVHRPTLDTASFGHAAAEQLLASGLLPPEYHNRYRRLIDELLPRIAERFAAVAPRTIRLHGDCHPGNILWTDAGPHFVDLDDCRMGPAVQDLWMLLSGERADQAAQLAELLQGYRLFCDFDSRQLALIEPLRTLRFIHYAAWLARRWDDPAFPPAFTWFGTPQYWEGHLNDLELQLELLDAPPLRID